jgi:hypothetical protein
MLLQQQADGIAITAAVFRRSPRSNLNARIPPAREPEALFQTAAAWAAKTHARFSSPRIQKTETHGMAAQKRKAGRQREEKPEREIL